jgi:hypothetical protein
VAIEMDELTALRAKKVFFAAWKTFFVAKLTVFRAEKVFFVA